MFLRVILYTCGFVLDLVAVGRMTNLAGHFEYSVAACLLVWDDELDR